MSFQKKQAGFFEMLGCALDRAVADGTAPRDFIKDVQPIMVKKGWSGPFYNLWLESIFSNSVSAFYAARKWENIQRVKATRPYLRYIAVLDDRTKPRCRALNDIILQVDDPFWRSHYPMGGCRCSVQQLGPRDLERYGLQITKKENLPKI